MTPNLPLAALSVLVPLVSVADRGAAPAPAPAQTPPSAQRLAWGDLDGDGRLDLYAASESGGRLLCQAADGSFAAQAASPAAVAGTAAQWRDVDADGDDDLLVWGADGGHLFVNEAGVLRDATVEAGLVHDAGVVTALEWLDVNGDGREDLLLTASRPLLFADAGRGYFQALELGVPGELAPAPRATPLVPLPAPDAAAADAAAADAAADAAPASSAGSTAAASSGPALVKLRTLDALTSPCTTSLTDALLGDCISASAVPTLGMLMPLSKDFNVDAGGRVGVGTLKPAVKLDVAGDVRATGQLVSSVTNGPPLAVSSTELVSRLNADLLDGFNASAFSQLGSSIEGSEITNGTIGDADVSSSAAIAGTKVSPSFGSQTVTTTGSLGVGTTIPGAKLDVVGDVRASGKLVSTATTGAPLAVSSSIVVPQLNADLLDGFSASAFSQLGSSIEGSEITNGTIGDADISSSAAIAGTKVAPSFGSQTVTTTGNLGVGTTSPVTRMQVNGGSDVKITGGGFLQLGADNAANVGFDDNEIMARNNGAASTLALNSESGNVTVSANGAGRLGVGTASPTGRLHVVDASGGDGAVVLPTGSISRGEILDEPGVAGDVNDSGLYLGETEKSLCSRTITVPTDGYIVAVAAVHVENFFAVIGSVDLRITDDIFGSGDPSWGWTTSGLIDSTIISPSRVFQVSAGSHTIYFRGRSIGLNNQFVTKEKTLTLMFFPTAYGTVDS